MKISDISLENILEEKLQDQLPEFYELKDVFEHNDAHEETAFTHTLRVLSFYEDIDGYLSLSQQKYFDQKFQQYTKMQLMRLVVILHDIGKKETSIIINWKTEFPWHAEKSYEKSLSIVERFDLSVDEKTWVLNIIRDHQRLHTMLTQRENDEDVWAQADEIKNQHEDIFLPLVIFDLLDTLSLREMDKDEPEEFEFRINFFKQLLASIVL